MMPVAVVPTPFQNLSDSFWPRRTRSDILILDLPAKKASALTVPSSDIIFFLPFPIGSVVVVADIFIFIEASPFCALKRCLKLHLMYQRYSGLCKKSKFLSLAATRQTDKPMHSQSAKMVNLQQ